MAKKIVLAYSGGLDTSVILHWLKETYKAEIIAFVADLGQGEELKAIKERALKTGASKVYVEDLKEEFVKDYVFPMLRGNAIYETGYLLGTSIARPLIAKRQVEIAKKEKAYAIAHGATGKGNDQVRFELTAYALEPSIEVIAPWRIWDFKSRSDLIDYAKKNKIPVPVTKSKPYSSDRNLFHISYEGGILEDITKEPPDEIFQITCSPEKAPDKAEYIEIEFKGGDPVAVNNKKMKPHVLLDYLNKIGGKHGIGRDDIVENRFVGMKSRGVYETPGGTILHKARRALEAITLDREVLRIKDSLITKYAELIYYGFWFSPERELIQKFIDEASKRAEGKVRLKLYKGNIIIAGRESKKSLYMEKMATFEADDIYNQKDAEGFIKINALRLRIKAMLDKSDF